MTKRRVRVETFVEEALCPECEKKMAGQHALRQVGDAEPGVDNELLFLHRCPNCGFDVKFPGQFPAFIFEPAPDAQFEIIDEKKRVVVAS